MGSRIRYAWVPVGLGVLVLTALALAVLTVSGAAAPPAAAEGKHDRIASASSNGLRVEVTAIRVEAEGNQPPAATVRVAAFKRSGGAWERIGRSVRVGERGDWLWRVITRPYGVRKLALERIAASDHPTRVRLRLLVSPSIGPSGTFRFTIDRGRLVAVDV